MNKVIVTGAIGFIGFHLSKKLLEMEYDVIGIDKSYSSGSTWPEDTNPIMKKIKNDRLKILKKYKNFSYHNISIGSKCIEYFKGPLSIVHLAARAGIPFSKEKPLFYEMDNTYLFASLMYNLKAVDVVNFVYASSSSVYGGNNTPTGCTEDMVLNPLNIYAATKWYNELQAKLYGELYYIPVTGLRFFTVIGGTHGRIDMMAYKFCKAILAEEPVLLNNGGEMFRDFTPVENIVSGIILALEKPQIYKIYNLGCGKSIRISDALTLIEKYLGKCAIIQNMPFPKGEVLMSLSNIDLARKELGYEPKVCFEESLEKYIEWYQKYFK